MILRKEKKMGVCRDKVVGKIFKPRSAALKKKKKKKERN
jgi:hypothetical protein